MDRNSASRWSRDYHSRDTSRELSRDFGGRDTRDTRDKRDTRDAPRVSRDHDSRDSSRDFRDSSPRREARWSSSDYSKKRRSSYNGSVGSPGGYSYDGKPSPVRKRRGSGRMEGSGTENGDVSIANLQTQLLESKRAENLSQKELLDTKAKAQEALEATEKVNTHQAEELKKAQAQIEQLQKQNEVLKKVALGKKVDWKKGDRGEKCNKCEAIAIDRCWKTGIPLCVEHYEPVPFKPENVRLVAAIPTPYTVPHRSITSTPNDYATIATVNIEGRSMKSIYPIPSASHAQSFFTLDEAGLSWWDVSGRKREHTPFTSLHSSGKTRSKVSQESNRVALVGGNSLDVVDLTTKTQIYSLRSSSESPWPCWSPDARAPGISRFGNGTAVCLKNPLCFVGDESGCIHGWDLTNQRHMRIFFAHTSKVTAMDITSDGLSLVSGSLDGMVRVHNLQTGSEFHINMQTPVSTIAASPKDPFIIVGCVDGTVHLIDITTSCLVGEWKVDKYHNECTSVTFAPSGDWFVSAGKTPNEKFDHICVWGTHDQKRHLEIKEPNPKGTPGVNDCAVSSQDCLYAASGCGSAYVYLMREA